MRKSEKRASSRIDSYILFTAVACLITLVLRILLGRMIGDNGMAYFATANEWFIMVAGLLAYGLSEAMAVLVRYRIKREQYKSARKLFHGALFLGTVVGVCCSVLFFFLGQTIARRLMKMPNAGLAISMMAPAVFFMILAGVFRGYFKGRGSKVLSIHSQLIYAVFLTASGLLFGELLQTYGARVSALLQNDDFTNAYGAMGAAAGILVASFFCFVHGGIVYLISKRAMKPELPGREWQKNQDTPFRIIRILFGTALPYFLFWFVFCGKTLIDQLCFFNTVGESSGKISQWGAYYGKCIPVLGILAGIFSLPGVMQVRRITSLAERQEHRLAKEKLGILIHQCAAWCIPAAVLLAVLAQNITGILFSGSNLLATGLIQWGSLLLVLIPFTAVFSEMLSRGRKQKMIAGIGFGALLLHSVLALLLLNLKVGIVSLIAANIVFYLVICGVEFWFICRTYQYRQEWIRAFAVTIVAAALCGVIAMLLNMAFEPLLGNAISLLISLLVAIPVYLVLLLVMRAFREEELEGMAGGRVLLKLGQLLHFM